MVSILSLSPVTSTMMESGPTSTISARKMSTISMIWLRIWAVACTLIRASSRATLFSSEMSRISTTSTSLSSCFTTWSASVLASTTKVMRENPAVSEWPTARLSMLNPRCRHLLAMRLRTPGRSSTRAMMV